MADEKLGLKYGNWVYNTTDTSKDGNGLPTAINKGTIYVAKTSDGHAQMYVDSPSGERLAIGSAGAGSFFATCNTAMSVATKVITCPGLSTPVHGTMLIVKFANLFDASINNIKLKINNTTYDLNNATYDGKDDLGLRGSFITFIYDSSINGFEILDNEFWNRITPSTILSGEDDSRHYLISTSASYDNGDGTTGLGPSGLYVPNYQAPYIDAWGGMTLPSGWLEINNDNSAHRVAFYPSSIEWYRDGYYEYYLDVGSTAFNLYDANEEQDMLWISSPDWQLYTPFDIYTDGNIYSEYRITCNDLYTYGGVSSTGNISTAGNLYHKQGVRVPRVWSGTTVPSDSVGENGDIYIMYS